MQQPPWDTLPLTHIITAVKSRLRQVAGRLLAPYGLSPQQFQMLLAVAGMKGACHGDLARATWMDKPTASRVLRALERRGLVRLEPAPHHGRKLSISLDPRARPLVKDLEELRLGIRQSVEQDLAPGEGAEVRRILAKVMTSLDRMEPGPAPAPAGR